MRFRVGMVTWQELIARKDLPVPQSLLSIKTVWVRDERKRWSSVILDPLKV